MNMDRATRYGSHSAWPARSARVPRDRGRRRGSGRRWRSRPRSNRANNGIATRQAGAQVVAIDATRRWRWASRKLRVVARSRDWNTGDVRGGGVGPRVEHGYRVMIDEPPAGRGVHQPRGLRAGLHQDEIMRIGGESVRGARLAPIQRQVVRNDRRRIAEVIAAVDENLRFRRGMPDHVLAPGEVR